METKAIENEELVLNMIQGQIGYDFKNLDLLKQACTRRSYSAEHGGANNEVLEFIGDKVLDYFVVKFLITKSSNSVGLYKKFDPKLKHSFTYEKEAQSFPKENVLVSNYTESKLTDLKKILVQKKSLAKRIDDLGFAEYLIMGNGDILNNLNQETSVKEDLFEAILGAVAIDCNWNAEKLESVVEIMLEPETFLKKNDEIDYVQLIHEWQARDGLVPFFKYKEASYSSTWYMKEDNTLYQQFSLDYNYSKLKFHCYLKIRDAFPVFCGFGTSKSEARKESCKLAYTFLEKNGYSFSIRDEIDELNKNEAISQLEILARRGYFSIPTYNFEQTYDKDGNPIWKSICHIEEKQKSFSAKSSSKKEAKKTAAFKMLQYVLNE